MDLSENNVGLWNLCRALPREPLAEKSSRKSALIQFIVLSSFIKRGSAQKQILFPKAAIGFAVDLSFSFCFTWVFSLFNLSLFIFLCRGLTLSSTRVRPWLFHQLCQDDNYWTMPTMSVQLFMHPSVAIINFILYFSVTFIHIQLKALLGSKRNFPTKANFQPTLYHYSVESIRTWTTVNIFPFRLHPEPLTLLQAKCIMWRIL